VWTQQGEKLVGSDEAAPYSAQQGWAVALSADGDTAIVGGPLDGASNVSSGNGAAWVFTRNGGIWTQQGSKLGNDAAFQGRSVSLSADGNTAIVGGPEAGNNSDTAPGAAWVFSRSGGVWTQQGSLVGTGALGPGPQLGWSVSLSADGSTAIVGGPYDNAVLGSPNAIGAVWVFTRSGGVWTQQSKLIGTGVLGNNANQGQSVSLSADGSTAIVGGPSDNVNTGAAWVFVQPSLQVTPTTNMVATGNQGSPFAPLSFQYQLSASDGSVNYSISGLPIWLTATPASGNVSPSGTTVIFTVNE